jgi:hypothetical protein
VRATNDKVSRADIERVEARIEELAEAIERCRKLSLAAKIAAGAGGIWIMLTLLGVVTFEPSFAVAALAATIGGAVLLGSNKTTWEQTESALAAREALRAAMIEKLGLRVVRNGEPTIH